MDKKTLEVVKEFLKGKTIHLAVDLGCGYGEYGCELKKNVVYLMGVEKDKERAEHAKTFGCYDTVIVRDIREYKPNCPVDAVFLFDVIEHIPKEDGRKLIEYWKKWSNLILLTTPSKFFPIALNGHVCVWSEEELRSLGFKVRKYKRGIYSLVFGEELLAWWQRR